jgi:agmatine/peptidylarginine deiminase
MNAIRNKLGIVILIVAILVLAQACASIRATKESVSPNVVPARESATELKSGTEKEITKTGPWPNGDHPAEKPTPPPTENITILPEEQKASFLIIAYPLSDLTASETSDLDKINDLYLSLVREAGAHVKILILVTSHHIVDLLISLFEENGLNHFVEDGTVDFLITGVESRWVRDYGGFIALGDSGRIYIIDPIYYDVREDERREDDDATPSHIQNLLRKQNIRSHLIRPPLILQGGNFYILGDICFTSTETLLENDCNEDNVNRIFQEYFGCHKIVYLTPLPGPAIKHIDMFLKIVDENTILIGQYDEPEPGMKGAAWLWQKKAKEVLDENARIIQDTLKEIKPNLKIVRMPMPNIVAEKDTKMDEDIKNMLKGMAVKAEDYLFKVRTSGREITGNQNKLLEEMHPVILQLDLPNERQLIGEIEWFIGKPPYKNPKLLLNIDQGFEGELNSGNSISGELRKAFKDKGILLSQNTTISVLIKDKKWQITDRIKKYEVRKEKGELNVYGFTEDKTGPALDTEAAQIRFVELCGQFLNEWVIYQKIFIRISKVYVYYYRTYLNSTLIQTSDQQILLIPRYSGLEEMESEVRSLYQQTYPNAKIIFINCDHLITQHGAIHCITITLPELQNLEFRK